MTRFWFIAGLSAFAVVLLYAGLRSNPKPNPRIANEREILYYRDPMHPAFTSDKPGRAPDCGMPLDPVYAGGDGALRVSPERQQTIGIRLARAEKTSETHMLRTLGRVALDEKRIFPVTAAAEGWVTEVLAGDTGATVKKGQPLVKIYGREYTAAQRTFLYALSTFENSRKLPAAEYQQTPSNGMQEARLVLESMGMAEPEIQELISNRQALLNISVTAPASGVIVARNVFLKKPFERGTLLFQIGDLSHVWIMADFPGDEAQYVRPGAAARVTVPGRPGTELRAIVGEALPFFNSGSRTFKVRLEVSNASLLLRPEMFVDLEVPVRLPETLTVPVDAVLESGLRQTVFVSRAQGVFEPRVVETGWRFGGRVQILKGIEAGESIVVSGNFLLDAESRIRLSDPRGQ